MDCGSTLLPTYITNEIPSQLMSDMIIDIGVADVIKLYMHDCIEFVSDLHTVCKLKVSKRFFLESGKLSTIISYEC